MKNEMIPVVQAVAEYMPPRKNGPFEKFMEVAHLILDHEPISIITHTVDGAIQTFGMIRETKYRAEAFKYATHLEEVRINAAVEIARIQQGKAINLYIDRQFQNSLDYMEATYIAQANAMRDYGRKMICEIDRRVESGHKGLDRVYINTVKENEMKCAMYRDFIDRSSKEGVTQKDVTFFLIQKLGENMHRYDSRAVSSVCNVIQEMMRQDPTISFEEYLGLEKRIKQIR